jgi:hypothetical protein
VASRFLENITEASVQAREEIQEKSEVEVGEAAVDEGCEDCTAEFSSMWVNWDLDMGVNADCWDSCCGLWRVILGLESNTGRL